MLRRIKRDDLAALFEMRNDPGIYRWCRQFAPLHWANHERWYDWQAKDPNTEMFAIALAGADGPIGVCGLTSIDYINKRAEFSLYIEPSWQKGGLGRDHLKRLFDFGFNSLGLNRIWGESFEGNVATKLFETLGMELEGVRREHYFRAGRFIDAHLYSLSAADFNSLHTVNNKASQQQKRAGGFPKDSVAASQLEEVWSNLTKITRPDQT